MCRPRFAHPGLRNHSGARAPNGPHGGSASPDLLLRMNPRNFSPGAGGLPAPTHEQIAALAHEIWQERGCPDGSDIDIWLEAERQLNGAEPTTPRAADEIPADPDRVDPDADPALNPDPDRELNRFVGRDGVRSPTSFDV
jgi:hypothetical protein